ncbi:MAG: hypothetical protein LBL93_02715, partial [Ruminococcus sp.]|nr:hypothetical protein [Ruminococcus sp.]
NIASELTERFSKLTNPTFNLPHIDRTSEFITIMSNIKYKDYNFEKIYNFLTSENINLSYTTTTFDETEEQNYNTEFETDEKIIKEQILKCISTVINNSGIKIGRDNQGNIYNNCNINIKCDITINKV